MTPVTNIDPDLIKAPLNLAGISNATVSPALGVTSEYDKVMAGEVTLPTLAYVIGVAKGMVPDSIYAIDEMFLSAGATDE